ncbi:MAG: prepilin-type N-terminal cleavage/methylation domain-containing protein [Synergistaceae bacterium]|jgi:prepilin-type N-terminal cleavage/methylation domain-containing protein|nr:prepilin-type N-terminal cleavage/methylation domain-containing protein [Synergistaceae bacterium]
MSINKKDQCRGKKDFGKKGFTVVEVLMAMLIGSVVVGASTMLMNYGIGMMNSNMAYTAAQRGALSSVEMMSKGVVAASEVEIISDDAHHDFTAGLEDDWHYIVLDSDLKTVQHVYQKDDVRVAENISGSEYIEGLSFDTEAFPKNLKGGRLLRVYVKGAYGQKEEMQPVELERSMTVHAALGVLGENASAPGEGPVLRYRLGVPPLPKLEIYGSTNPGKAPSGVPFDYENPDTWKYLKHFNYFTELDAHLTLPKKFLDAVGKSAEDVIFTWIVADPTIFEHDIVNGGAKKNSAAILEYLEDRVSGYLEEDVGWDLLSEKYKIQAIPDSEGNLPAEMIAELLDDPFNLQDKGKSKGFQLMAVKKGQPVGEDSDIFELEGEFVESKKQKFNLGAAVNGLAAAYDYYKGAYMIVVAKFPDGKDGWKKWPVYVKLGNYKGDTMFQDMLNQLAETKKEDATINTNLGDTFVNAAAKYGKLEEVVTNGERRYFEVTGNTGGGSTPAPIVLKKLIPEDFSHMIPRGTVDKDEILYGVTNYAVYVDVEVPNSGSGGFGVLLNGSKVSATNDKHDKTTEYRSGGYIYQFDPGANGLLIRYFGYHRQSQYKFGQVNGFQWGARPMYFYDAAKENFPAPGTIDFFKTAAATDIVTRRESFNENVGAGINDKINYRIPFSARMRSSMSDFQGVDLGTTKFSSKTEGRDEESYGGMRSPDPSYGLMFGPGYATSLYSPKHMQSWHNYNYSKQDIVDMLAPNAKNDKRLGFRWDRSWHLHRDTEPAGIQQYPVWEQRHILKLTILEVTRDITAGEVDEEWRYNIYHKNDKPLTNKNLTKLADSYVIHQAGDMIDRAELIHLKPGATDWNNSRNYVYSKPVWYGKFKGDAWRGDDPSPFKKLGNTLQHIVADPEPEQGDDQSYRRRGMRVRSWKEAFLGWDFSKVTLPNYRYVWRNFVDGSKETYDKDDPFGVVDVNKSKRFPPDFYESVYASGEAGRVDFNKTQTAHSVWTPPIAINLDADNARENEKTLPFTAKNVRNVSQSGDPNKETDLASAKTFGQYMKGEYVERERRPKWGSYEYAYNGKYSPHTYGRLSLLRPWRDELPNQATPIFGLYALRGWDFGTSRLLEAGKMKIYDSAGNTAKRFLTVVQGLQLPFLPKKLKVFSDEYNIVPRDLSSGGDTFKPDRDRVIGFRFWDNAVGNIAASRTRLYDTWIGEGFSPREVRAILGLTTTDEEKIRGTYVHASMEEEGFYVPAEEGDE